MKEELIHPKACFVLDFVMKAQIDNIFIKIPENA